MTVLLPGIFEKPTFPQLLPESAAQEKPLEVEEAERAQMADFLQSETAAMLESGGVDPVVAANMDAVAVGADENEVDENELLQTPAWRMASGIAHDYANKVNDYEHLASPIESSRRGGMQQMRNLAQAPQTGTLESNRTDDEKAQFGLEFAGMLNYNLASGLINLADIENMPQEVALAQAALLEEYERLPPLSWNGTVRLIKALMTDPFTYAGGVGGLKIVQKLLAGGGAKALRQRLMRVALGGAGVGAEGSAYAAVGEYAMQRAKFAPDNVDMADPDDMDEAEAQGQFFQPDWSAIRNAAVIGAGAGATLGIAAGQAGNIVKGVRAGMRAVGRMAGDGSTLRSGIGPVDAGRPAASVPDELGFRSGLIKMLDELPERGTGEHMLATLSNKDRLGKFGAKAEELELTGIADYLRGKESVTKKEIADWLESNRVRLDQATDEDRAAGYYAGDYEVYSEDASSLDELMREVDTDRYEFNRGVVTGRVEGDDEAYHDVLIDKRFNISDTDLVGDVLDDVELTINNDAYYMDPENAGTLEEIQNVLGRLRTKLRDAPGAWNQSNTDIDDLFTELDELAPGLVFDSMDARAQYDIVDPQDGYTIDTVSDENDAVHIAREYIEDLDGPDGGIDRHASVTYPRSAGEQLKNYKIIRLLMPEDDKRFPSTNVGQHFEQNTYAHFRSSDREFFVERKGEPDLFGGFATGAPETGMFVEEMQSDLVQKGGKRGWKNKDLTLERVLAAQRAVERNLQEKLKAFGYGKFADETAGRVELYETAKHIVDNLAGLYTGFSRMVRGKDRVEKMTEYLEGKLISSPSATMSSLRLSESDGTVFDPSVKIRLQEAIDRIVETVAALPKKKAKDDQIYEAFQIFVTELQSLRDGGNEVGGAVRDLSPKRYQKRKRPGMGVTLTSDDYDLGLEMLDKLDAKDLQEFYNAGDLSAVFEGGVPDVPMRSAWIENTMKRAIAEGLSDGHNIIAFPNHADTISDIEGYGAAGPPDPIKRLYEIEVPKLLKKLAKQYGGTVEVGAIEGSNRFHARRWASIAASWSRPDSGSVIILRLSPEEGAKIKREGLALPSAAGLGAALGAREIDRRRRGDEKQEQPAAM